MNNDIDGLEPLAAVLTRDERWLFIGNRTIEQHHALIAQYVLHRGVPSSVIQHFENAKNTWLYAFYSYRLLQVALLQLHVAGEAAIKEKARREDINLKKANTLEKLLQIALERNWLQDANFSVAAESGPVVKSQPQSYSQLLTEAFRGLRNSLAHGEVMLDPTLSWAFQAVGELINQLFPTPNINEVS